MTVLSRRPYYRGGRKAGFHCMSEFKCLINQRGWKSLSEFEYVIIHPAIYTFMHVLSMMLLNSNYYNRKCGKVRGRGGGKILVVQNMNV